MRPDPVPDELITRMLQAAIKAPLGGVRQGWSIIVIRDQETRRKIGDLYRTGTRSVIGPDMRADERRFYGAAQYLEDVPVLIVACIQADPETTAWGSSIYPAIQNLPLAARGLELGSVWTTRQTRLEEEIKQLFSMPEDVVTAALSPIGFPAEGALYGPTRRRPRKKKWPLMIAGDRVGNITLLVNHRSPQGCGSPTLCANRVVSLPVAKVGSSLTPI